MSGKRKVAAGIAGAAPAVPSSPAAGSGGPPQGGAPPSVKKRFKMEPDGLFKISSDDDKPPLWVCGHFEIEAETKDEDLGRWGLLVSWHDRSGREVLEVFPRSLFAGDCGELRSRLADGGLTLAGTPAARQALAEYLNLVSSNVRARAVSRTGWYGAGTMRAFVLPGEVFGKPAEQIVLQATSRDASVFNQSETLADWQRQVALFCIGNSRLVFAVCCAFAGPLLELAGEDGGGIHYRGPSRVGKTTALRVAASVWGNIDEFIRTWRATGNGLEGIAALHSDTLLPLDEMGQTEARELGQIAYMLGSGQGKTRSDRSGGARPPARWRLLFLSTGEVGLADKSAEAGQRMQAGQEVRLVDVPADTGAHGIFEDLHEAENAAMFADALRAATRRCFGTAGRAFLRHLMDQLARDRDFSVKLRGRVDDRVRTWLASYPGASGQVRSVARRFALIAEAGQLATEGMVTGWAVDEAEQAAITMFRAWLSERGTLGAREDAQAEVQVRDFISLHKESRFQRWEDRKPPEGEQVESQEAPAAPRYAVQKAAGWKRWVVSPDGSGAWRYYLTPTGMDEALAGLNKAAALKALADAGFLTRNKQGKTSVTLKPPGETKMRLYEVLPSILGAGGDQDIEHNRPE